MQALEDLIGGPWDGLIIAANDIGCHLPTLDHWCTLHPEKLPKWEDARRANGHPDGYITWGRRSKQVARLINPWAGGASGLLALTVARELGVERAILCGVPMTRTPHFVESAVHPKDKIWTSADGHFRAWNKQETKAKLVGWVRSMSGRTQEMLGAPDLEWLYGEQEAAA